VPSSNSHVSPIACKGNNPIVTIKLAILEELINKEGLEGIEKSLEEYKKKDCAAVKSPESIREALMKD